MNSDFYKLVNLKDGEETELSGWFEEGGPYVKKQGGALYLFEVPQYGGDPFLIAEYGSTKEEIEELLKKASELS